MRRSHIGPARIDEPLMETLDDMRDRRLLTLEQHAEISAWVASSRTPEAIMAMPPELWRALALASMLMNVDADLTRPESPGAPGSF